MKFRHGVAIGLGVGVWVGPLCELVVRLIAGEPPRGLGE